MPGLSPQFTWVRCPDGKRGQAGHIFVQMIRDGLKPGYTIEEDHSVSEVQDRPAHSPLGASGAERWMECPGSVSLIKELAIPEVEHEYTKEGTALHAASEHCLKTGCDTWEIVGQSFENDVVITDAMAMAVQVYLDVCRPAMLEAEDYGIEYKISSPVHKDFYGTADFWALFKHVLKIKDLKGGEGIFVDPEDNPQLKYYGYGVIEMLELKLGRAFPDDFPVELAIVQPRLPWAELHRTWPTTVGEIKEWVHDTLVPAMCRAEYDETLDAGEHCRFCPAKLVCPLLTSLFRAAATYDPTHIKNYDDASLGRSYKYIAAVKHYIKALGEETERRLLHGREIDGAKLVKQKANRIWKPEALDLVKQRFGADAFTVPEIKSPAQIEALSPLGAETVKEWAYTPDSGLTVAPSTDRRGAIKVKPTAETFKDALAKLPE